MTKVDPSKIRRLQAGNLEVKVGLSVILEPEGVGVRFKTHLVGWDKDRYVMLHLPLKVEMREQLYVGKRVIVRYIDDEGQICGFESAIQGAIFTPQRFLVLDYPQTVEIFCLRKDTRVDCFIPATLTRQDTSLVANIINISSSGCRLALASAAEQSADPFVEGERLLCIFSIQAPEEQRYQLHCTLKKIQIEEDKIFLGVEFHDATPDVRQRIEDFVTEVKMFLGSRAVC